MGDFEAALRRRLGAGEGEGEGASAAPPLLKGVNDAAADLAHAVAEDIDAHFDRAGHGALVIERRPLSNGDSDGNGGGGDDEQGDEQQQQQQPQLRRAYHHRPEGDAKDDHRLSAAEFDAWLIGLSFQQRLEQYLAVLRPTLASLTRLFLGTGGSARQEWSARAAL